MKSHMTVNSNRNTDTLCHPWLHTLVFGSSRARSEWVWLLEKQGTTRFSTVQKSHHSIQSMFCSVDETIFCVWFDWYSSNGFCFSHPVHCMKDSSFCLSSFFLKQFIICHISFDKLLNVKLRSIVDSAVLSRKRTILFI